MAPASVRSISIDSAVAALAEAWSDYWRLLSVARPPALDLAQLRLLDGDVLALAAEEMRQRLLDDVASASPALALALQIIARWRPRSAGFLLQKVT